MFKKKERLTENEARCWYNEAEAAIKNWYIDALHKKQLAYDKAFGEMERKLNRHMEARHRAETILAELNEKHASQLKESDWNHLNQLNALEAEYTQRTEKKLGHAAELMKDQKASAARCHAALESQNDAELEERGISEYSCGFKDGVANMEKKHQDQLEHHVAQLVERDNLGFQAGVRAQVQALAKLELKHVASLGRVEDQHRIEIVNLLNQMKEMKKQCAVEMEGLSMKELRARNSAFNDGYDLGQSEAKVKMEGTRQKLLALKKKLEAAAVEEAMKKARVTSYVEDVQCAILQYDPRVW